MRSLILLCIPLFILAACMRMQPLSVSEMPNNSPDQTTSTELPLFWSQAAHPFQGTVLHGISENSPPSIYVRDLLIPAFEAETGIRVELQIDDNAKVEQVINLGLGDYDFVYLEQDVIYGYLESNRLVNLTQLMNENPTLIFPDFDTNDFTGFIKEFIEPGTENPRNDADGNLYGVPIEAFIKVYLYRKDLFEEPEIQAAFAAKYYYPLAPAVTFEQYRDIADFFTRYGQSEGIELWGTTVQATTEDVASFYEFFETIAPSFGVYDWGINPATYAATTAHGGQLDSKQAVAALAYWVDLLQVAPPDATLSTWRSVAETFAAGKAAQGWVYGEYVAWLATDPARSQVVGKVGVALPPTSPGVMEDATIGVGYLGYYDGAAFGIPANSQHKEAALLWLQYLGQSAVQPEWAINSGRVVHLSTFDEPRVQSQDRRLNGYYTLMKQQGHLFSGAPPFPFHAQIRDIITPFIHQAIHGNMTSQEALKQAAVAVEAELARQGYLDVDAFD